jgi:large subunit ribosomal protein L7/L12
MSQVTNEILEKLKTLTLIEATELVSKIEETFGVDASISTGGIIILSGGDATSRRQGSVNQTEKLTFDVILESVADDKRVATLKVIRSLTNLGLKEAKDFCSSLPKTVKEGISKEDAEVTKKELEDAGGTVVVK